MASALSSRALAAKDDTPVCHRCRRPITGKRSDLGGRPAHPQCVGDNWAEVQAMIAAATADGRHGPVSRWGTVCQGCGNWSHVWTRTLDGKLLCRKCSGG